MRPEVGGLNEQNLKHIWLLDVNKLNGVFRCAGQSGALGFVTASGTSVMQAKRRIKRTIKGLEIPHLQYREDIGEGFPKLMSSHFNY